MNNPPPVQLSGSFDYKGWRENFIVTILRIACVLGITIIAASFPTATTTDRILFISLYIILLVITVVRVNYSMRAFTLLFMVFTVGVNSILAWGPWLDGSVFFIAFIVLSALLFDQRVDIIASQHFYIPIDRHPGTTGNLSVHVARCACHWAD